MSALGTALTSDKDPERTCRTPVVPEVPGRAEERRARDTGRAGRPVCDRPPCWLPDSNQEVRVPWADNARGLGVTSPSPHASQSSSLSVRTQLRTHGQMWLRAWAFPRLLSIRKPLSQASLSPFQSYATWQAPLGSFTMMFNKYSSCAKVNAGFLCN